MKKILVASLLFFAVAPSWAKIGRHNLLLSFNAGAGIYHDKNMNSNSIRYSLGNGGQARGKALLGFDIAYLLHSVRESGTVHGMDLRLGVLGELPTTGYSGTLGTGSLFSLQSTQQFTFSNPMLLTLSVGYTPGHQFKNFRWMFDIFGASFSLAFASVHNINTGEKYGGVYAGTTITLPLGMHFILNNGAYAAVRHFIVVNPYSQSAREPVTKYALMFSLGYAFGK